MKASKGFIAETNGIDLFKTFNCGQCFRWEQSEDGFFEGVALGQFLRVKKENNKLYFENMFEKDYNNIWKNYLDIETDYEKIAETFETDEYLEKAYDYGKGIKILKQDPFETLISFIISQNNNIPRIKKIINLLCQHFGKKIKYKNKTYYAFPEILDLVGKTVEDLEVIRAGFRSKYILDAVQKISDKEIILETVSSMSYIEAKSELMKIKGVGEKVADCVLLYGFSKYCAFPKDVWILKTLKNHYCDEKNKCFGQYAGIAQQYLYYYSRNQKTNI